MLVCHYNARWLLRSLGFRKNKMKTNITHPMRIKLSNERKENLVRHIEEYYFNEFDEEISKYKSEQLLSFFIKELGPPVYNQAIKDSHSFMQEKLIDLESDFYEPEENV